MGYFTRACADGAHDLCPAIDRPAEYPCADACHVPSLYGPDGVPLDGPRTTAAEYAAWLGSPTSVRPYWQGVTVAVSGWRNVAADEGSRYSEAIRGARALREARVSRWMIPPTHPTWACELARGIPNDNRLTR